MTPIHQAALCTVRIRAEPTLDQRVPEQGSRSESRLKMALARESAEELRAEIDRLQRKAALALEEMQSE